MKFSDGRSVDGMEIIYEHENSNVSDICMGHMEYHHILAYGRR